MNNSKARSAAIYHAALVLVDGDPEASPKALAVLLCKQMDCHITTAWRHIKRALATKAGQGGVIQPWGGKRPGAGRTTRQAVAPDLDAPPETTDWRQVAIDLDAENTKLAAEVKRLQGELAALRTEMPSALRCGYCSRPATARCSYGRCDGAICALHTNAATGLCPACAKAYKGHNIA